PRARDGRGAAEGTIRGRGGGRRLQDRARGCARRRRVEQHRHQPYRAGSPGWQDLASAPQRRAGGVAHPDATAGRPDDEARRVRGGRERPRPARRRRRGALKGMQNYVGKGTVLELGLDIWSRRQWLAVVVFALMLAGTASVATFLPDIYRSTATVLVERHQVPETFVRSSLTD